MDPGLPTPGSPFTQNYSRATEPFNKLMEEHEIAITGLTCRTCAVHRVAVAETAREQQRNAGRKQARVVTGNQIIKGLLLFAPLSISSFFQLFRVNFACHVSFRTLKIPICLIVSATYSSDTIYSFIFFSLNLSQ